jgi:hypothetical protein
MLVNNYSCDYCNFYYFIFIVFKPAVEYGTRVLSSPNAPVVHYMFVYICVCMSGHNSGTPGAISTKLGTHIAICMCKNIMYVLYIYIPQGGWCGRQGIWMIHIVVEIKLLLLLRNRLVMTSRLATLVRRIHVSIFVATIKMDVCVCSSITLELLERFQLNLVYI